MNGSGENSSCLNGEKTSWAAASAKQAAARSLTARRFRLVSTPDPQTRMEELFGTVGARRWLNVTVAAIALLFMAPLMALIAIVIKVTSPGPVLFRQVRVGLDRRNGGKGTQDSRRERDLGGRPFIMYKFRTMHHNETPARQIWATPDDPRVTPIGRLLRKTRLDELPQLWNVLRGEMNIVGPRPEQPDIFSDLRTQLERYHHRQRVLPGITGHAQINLCYDCTVETVQEKLLLDLQYIERTSAREDLKIMLLTLPVMVTGKGAW